MKTAISVPDDIVRSADSLAKRLGVSRSKLFSSAMIDFLAKHNERSVTARLNAVYGAADSSLDRGLRTLQSRSLPREQW
jgi:metal-responsive CopG/Arc/MetJ family transcriptional regulator